MTPADAKTVTDFLLATLETEIRLTTSVFRAVPHDKLDYRPDTVSKTALDLIRHIVLEDEWILAAVADGRFSPVPDQSEACGLMTPGEAAAQYPERIRAAMARVQALPAEALTRELDLMGMLRMPAVEFVSLMVRHSAHHRGQLSAYLRAMGGKVPAIYGPSADTLAVSV